MHKILREDGDSLMRGTSFETPQGQFVSWLMGKVFHVQSIFEENGDIDEVGCIDENRSATAESTCAASQEEDIHCRLHVPLVAHHVSHMPTWHQNVPDHPQHH